MTTPAIQFPLDTAACCEPLAREVLTADQAKNLARVLRALSEPVRLRLLSLVASQESGEATTVDATGALGLPQTTVCYHFRVLVDAGLLRRDKRGVWAYYSVVPGSLEAIAALLMTTKRSS